MNMQDSFAKFNIDMFGVCDASDYNAHQNTDYNSCIVALFPYFDGFQKNSNLSIYAHGKDYHKVAGSILGEVAKSLELEDYKIHSDTGPEIERTLAVKAGLSFIGRNGMCINSKYGSFFFIGYIVCREKFELSKPNEDKCHMCMKCVDACPGDALRNGFCEDKCLSAITQKKGMLTEGERELLKNHNTIFGCDICQMVCPHNSNAERTQIPEFKEDKIARLTLSDIEDLSEREFRKKYADRAFSWRGAKILKRNLKEQKLKEQEDENYNT